tara:strand:+ start:436 stop:720 length:285 start_codon:yes stop_codon:yes gene_type:complete
MNERIKLLAEQATIKTSHKYHTWGDRIATETKEVFDKEKFAELIVQECLRQVEEQYKPILEDEAMMKDIRWAYYVDCGVDSYVAIREHFFGVEE